VTNIINRASGFLTSLIALVVPFALVAGLIVLLWGDTALDTDRLTFAVGVLAVLASVERLGRVLGTYRTGVIAR